MVSGSVNPVTERQLQEAEKEGFTRFSLRMEELAGGQFWETERGKQLLKEILSLQEQTDCLIADSLGSGRAAAKSQALTGGRTDKEITGTMGELARQMLLHSDAGRVLMIIGGDTLREFLDRTRIGELSPLCEPARGTVLVRLPDGRLILTKSGGFGEPGLLAGLELSICETQFAG